MRAEITLFDRFRDVAGIVSSSVYVNEEHGAISG